MFNRLPLSELTQPYLRKTLAILLLKYKQAPSLERCLCHFGQESAGKSQTTVAVLTFFIDLLLVRVEIH